MSSNENNNNLKILRIDKGLSIEEIAEELKLSTDVIKKLESGQFSELGAFPYVRGYLNNYTKLLGVDAQPYIDMVPKSEINIPLVNTSHSMAKGIKLKRRSKSVVSYALGTSILIAVSVSGWFVLKNYMKSSRPTQSIEIVETDSLEITPQKTSALADKTKSEKDDNYHYSSLIPSLEKSNTNPDDSMEAQDQSIQDNPDGGVNLEIPQKVEQETQQLPSSKYTISITAVQTSWVKVENFDGNKLHNDLLKPGTIVLESEQPVHFRIGNTKNVKIEINGETLKLSDFSKKNIADFNWPTEG
jgi:cytoskeleton protein RodZ